MITFTNFINIPKVKPEDKKDLPAVKEDDISTNKKDASNNSGCVLQ